MVTLALIVSLAIYYITFGLLCMVHFWSKASCFGMAKWDYKIIVLWPVYLLGALL